jgi:hypothetical protein
MTSRFFPATIPIDQARYPSIHELEMQMQEAGFSEVEPRSYTFTPVRLGEKYLHTVERRGFSMLHKITNEEYQEGLAKLREAMASQETLDYAAGYTFVWAFK